MLQFGEIFTGFELVNTVPGITMFSGGLETEFSKVLESAISELLLFSLFRLKSKNPTKAIIKKIEKIKIGDYAKFSN